MVVISTPLAMGIGQGLLTGFQGLLGSQARQQDYLNQVEQQKASDEFAQWTAATQARTQNLNNNYGYWQQQIAYGQDLAYAGQLRNFELSKAINQAEVVARTRASANACRLLENFSAVKLANWNRNAVFVNHATWQVLQTRKRS